MPARFSASPLRNALGSLIAMVVCMGIGRFIYTLILPGMITELGLSASDAGLIASANYFGYLLGAVAAAGRWAHGHERAVMLASLIASAVLCAAMGISDSLALFLAVRFLAGIASALAMIFMTSVLFSHLNAADRTEYQGIQFVGVGVGIFVSSVMMAGLLQFDANWRYGWLGAAVLSAVGVVAVFLMVDPVPARQQDEAHEPNITWSRPLVLITAAYGLFGLGYIVTATFLIAIVRESGFDRLFEAEVWAVTGLAVVPSVFFWSAIAKRTSRAAVFAIGSVVEAIGVAASVSLGGKIGPLLGGLLLGGTFVAITSVGIFAGRALSPLSSRRVVAAMTVVFGIGQIIGPIVAGFLAEMSGSFVIASMGAALVLLAAAAVSVMSARATNSP